MLIALFVEYYGYYFDYELMASSAGYVRNAFVLSCFGEYSEFEHLEKILLDAMSLNDCTPSHAQSIRMKKSAQQGTLSSDSIYEIMSEEKANQTEHISFKVQDLRSFFPKNYTQKQMTETILKLLYDYHRKIERKRNSRDER